MATRPGLPESGQSRPHPAFSLLTEGLHDVRVDAELRQARARVYYAFDIFDLINFSFPVNPSRDTGIIEDQVYNDQVALFEVFHRPSSLIESEYGNYLDVSSSSILLPEYRRELDNFLVSVKKRADETERLIAILKGTSDVNSSASPEQAWKDLKANANIHLAVLMGFDQIGTARMQEVVDRSTTVPEVARGLGLPGIDNIEPGPLADDIFNEWWPRLDSQQGDASLRDRRRNNARSDADAVARVIQLTGFAERAYLEGKLGDRRAIFLYLSSAHRTRQLFDLDSVQRALPRVDGRALNIWRTRSQVFANIVFREYATAAAGPREEDFGGTFTLLEDANALRERASGRSSTGCAQCVLNRGTGELCELQRICVRMKDSAFQNNSLISRLRRYSDLLKKQPKTPDHEKYIAFFREVMEQERLPDIELTRRHELRSIRLSRENTTQYSSSGRYYLPAVPELHDPEYRDIGEGILEYGRLAATEPTKAQKRLHELEGRFLKLESDNEPSVEHEIVRAMFYLTFGSEETRGDRVTAHEGDRKAVAQCRRMMREYPEQAAEFRYIMVWAMNRLEQYRDARIEATEGIKSNPSDPRFYHGRALVTSSWFDRQQLEIRKRLGKYVGGYLTDAEAAVDLYLSDPIRFRRAIAINLNNIAWEHSQEEYGSFSDARSVYDPLKGIAALQRLEELIPREQWSAILPSLPHTSAHVYYTAWRVTGQIEYLHIAKKFGMEAATVQPQDEDVIRTNKQIDDALALTVAPIIPGCGT